MVLGKNRNDLSSLWARKKRLPLKIKRTLWGGRGFTPVRIAVLSVAVVGLVFIGLSVFRYFAPGGGYEISAKAETLLPEPVPSLASELTGGFSSYEYNKDYTTPTEAAGLLPTPRFSATFSKKASNGVTVVDPLTKTEMKLKPKFGLKAPKKQDNRLIYPVKRMDAQSVYTMQPAQLKEDIILNSYQGDTVTFDYEIVLPDGVEARSEANGSIGVYSVNPNLLGSVTTGSDKDQQLLDSARKNGEKNTLLFTIPAPFVVEYNKKNTDAHAWLSLDGTTMTLHAEGLKNASYPLSIDPSVYIETAAKLMQGNNESNIDFDVDNELIQKGKTTGGRFDAWTSTTPLPAARWNGQTAVYGGYIYTVGGNSGSTAQSTVYWAKINNTTGAIEAPNPGAGACTDWCTDSNYNLPSTRQGAALVIYSGYMYVIGGYNGAGTRQDTVYIAKIGSNGEPQLWHPTESKKTRWAYWYSDTALSSARSYLGAVAYNNTMYVVGGTTSGTPNGITTVEKATITPNGTLKSWTSVTSLPAGRYSMGVQQYNGYIYAIGGANNTTTQTTIYYNKIKSDGTLNAAWQTNATALANARAGLAGSFSAIWGGYIYVAGGCSTVSAQYYCSSIASDIQLASINADGSTTDWTTIAGITGTRVSYGFVAWRNALYAIGGCTASNTATQTCGTASSATYYGSINSDGDVSTVSTSVSSGTSPCVSATWYDCDLPPQGDGNGEAGGMSGGAIINNGYIYYMGGCTSVGNNSVCFTGNSGKSTDNIAYAQIDSVGNITRISSCSGSFVGSWCAINGTGVLPTKVSAFGYTVFNNTMYVIGGTTGTQWQDSVMRATFNSDGTWGTWSTQTFASVGLGNAKGYQYAFTRANPSSAGTYPGNLYVLGGCSGVTAADNGLDCTGSLYTEVYKCYIKTDGSIESSGSTCTTSGQLQIDSEPGTGGSQGLGVAAGTVYANYIYLIGGQSPNEPERGEVLYAKIDNSNNIVAADGGSTWVESPYSLDPIRRRGTAFGYNGYLYAMAGSNVSDGSLNDLLYAKINVSDGSISDFTTSSVTVSYRWDLRTVVNNGYVYTVGGCSVGTPPASCTTMTSSVQTFQLYNNYSGSPKAYSSGTQYSTDRYGAGSAVLNGYLYLAGGCTTTTDCTTATTSVQYSLIGDDGTLGTWSAGTGITAARAWGKLAAVGGSLYFIGGQASGSANGQTTVYYATPNPSTGATGSWSSGTALPAGRTQFGMAVWNDRIYVVGGNDAAGSATSTVYVSSKQTSGGNISSWDSSGSTSFNVARSGLTAIAYANNLYVLGGYTGSQYLNDVQFASIGYKTGTISQSGTTVTGSGTTFTSGMVGKSLQYGDGYSTTITAYSSATSITVADSRTVASGTSYSIDTGTVGSWTYSTSLPFNMRQADGFAANGFMYLFGGRSGTSTCNSNTIVAPISANTVISSGNNPTGIGEWYATNIRYTGDRYGPTAAYYQGKAYVMGGHCSSIVTTTNRVQQTTLQSQPQVAKYSRMIDTDTNVFPTQWLLNGVDNSIGAHWQTSYRSAFDSYYVRNHVSLDEGTNGNGVDETINGFNNCYGTNSGTNKYSNAQYVTPGLSANIDIASGSGGGGCNEDFSTTNVYYGRFYFYTPTAIGSNMTLWNLSNEGVGGEVVASFRIRSSDQKLQLRDKTTAQWTSSSAVPTGVWNRIELAVVNDTAYVRVYWGDASHSYNQHGNVADETGSTTLTNAATDYFDRSSIGVLVSQTAPFTMYFDDFKTSNSYWPGSAFPQWGQITNFGDVSLGTLNTFTPKDSAGSNTSYARWYYFLDSIDSQQTYGYPEDVSRGPTIADKTLFFTADPSKRLMHGRTFTGGEQQPLDTPKYNY